MYGKKIIKIIVLAIIFIISINVEASAWLEVVEPEPQKGLSADLIRRLCAGVVALVGISIIVIVNIYRMKKMHKKEGKQNVKNRK